MSWDAYVQKLVTENKAVAGAAILGWETPGVWAATPGLTGITAEENKKLAGGKNERASLTQNGVYLAGQRYRLIRDQLDEDNVNLMDLKMAADAEGNTYGACVGKTVKALVIVKGTKDANGGQLANPVFKMVDYLRRLGF